MELIKIAVPIVLIVLSMIDILRIVMSSMEKTSEKTHKIMYRFLAAIIVFLVPTFVNVAMSILDRGNIQASSCWVNANENFIEVLEAVEEEEENDKNKAKQDADQKLYEDRAAAALAIRKTLVFTQNNAPTGTGGDVLIIAGHCYTACGSGCRERADQMPSGYSETDQTRLLAIELKKELIAAGKTAVIANQVLTGNENDTRMDACFNLLRSSRSDLDAYWKKFGHVVEIHFNASGSATASGSELVVSAGKRDTVTPVSNNVLASVARFTGKNRGIAEYSGGALGDYEYFHSAGIPISYIEIEFYDNKAAMDQYTANKSAIAKAIANTLK